MKIIALPFVFIWSTFLVVAGLIFPTSITMLFSFGMFITYPFAWVINKGMNSSMSDAHNDPFISGFHPLIGHFLGMTILIWFPFYSCYYYYKNEKLII